MDVRAHVRAHVSLSFVSPVIFQRPGEPRRRVVTLNQQRVFVRARARIEREDRREKYGQCNVTSPRKRYSPAKMKTPKLDKGLHRRVEQEEEKRRDRSRETRLLLKTGGGGAAGMNRKERRGKIRRRSAARRTAVFKTTITNFTMHFSRRGLRRTLEEGEERDFRRVLRGSLPSRRATRDELEENRDRYGTPHNRRKEKARALNVEGEGRRKKKRGHPRRTVISTTD